MTWYSAHIIMFVEFKGSAQDHFPVWENIVLIAAPTEDEAFSKAERIGRSGEGDDGGSFRWGKEPARWVFAGVRKITECETSDDRPGDGTELTYNELELDSREAVKKWASGKRVQVTSTDHYRPAREGTTERGSKPARRRRA